MRALYREGHESTAKERGEESADPKITWTGIEDIERPIIVVTTAKFTEVATLNKNLSYREPLVWAEDLAETLDAENEHSY